MRLQQRGELQLLKEIKERFDPSQRGQNGAIVVSIGDDAAVFKPFDGYMLVTTDLMAEGIHFDLSYTSPFHLGFKLVSINVSDIYAMGGVPRYIFLNVAFRSDTSEEFFWEFFKGVEVANSIYSTTLLGGDISAVLRDSMVSATVIGSSRRIIRRSNAKVGDRIYITNTIGNSACGLEILRRLIYQDRAFIRDYRFGLLNKEVDFNKKELVLEMGSKRISLEFSLVESLLKRHLVPLVSFPEHPSIDHITAMIDVSDGLFIDLNRICDESKVGARVFLEKLPMSKDMLQVCSIIGLNPYNFATSGGEDYELLFTTSESEEESFLNSSLMTSGAVLTCIGEIISDERVVVMLDGTEIPLKSEGYQHFSS
ncbi:MAG: thiamine-phosphate kinase [Thermodesulfovibrionales bacterium]|nr:thiamine-phosphate kinase [Thermodesulfovibrionales bacterium]